MFLLQQIQRCGVGRSTEALQRLHWIHSMMAEHPGAIGMIVAKYLGNPFDFLVLRQWRDRTAYDDFMASPSGQFPSSKPAGIYQSLPIERNWQEVLETPGYAHGTFVWRSTYNVPRERWDEFIRLRQEEDKLAQWYGLAEHPGSAISPLVESRTFKSTDDVNAFLSIVRLTDRSSMEDIIASPSRAEIAAKIAARETHTGTAKAPRDCVVSDCFEVVSEFSARPEVTR